MYFAKFSLGVLGPGGAGRINVVTLPREVPLGPHLTQFLSVFSLLFLQSCAPPTCVYQEACEFSYVSALVSSCSPGGSSRH